MASSSPAITRSPVGKRRVGDYMTFAQRHKDQMFLRSGGIGNDQAGADVCGEGQPGSSEKTKGVIPGNLAIASR